MGIVNRLQTLESSSIFRGTVMENAPIPKAEGIIHPVVGPPKTRLTWIRIPIFDEDSGENLYWIPAESLLGAVLKATEVPITDLLERDLDSIQDAVYTVLRGQVKDPHVDGCVTGVMTLVGILKKDLHEFKHRVVDLGVREDVLDHVLQKIHENLEKTAIRLQPLACLESTVQTARANPIIDDWARDLDRIGKEQSSTYANLTAWTHWANPTDEWWTILSIWPTKDIKPMWDHFIVNYDTGVRKTVCLSHPGARLEDAQDKEEHVVFGSVYRNREDYDIDYDVIVFGPVTERGRVALYVNADKIQAIQRVTSCPSINQFIKTPMPDFDKLVSNNPVLDPDAVFQLHKSRNLFLRALRDHLLQQMD